ncbi:MAG TPA: DHA2 family efflux MFS transporter permease subunit [Streptosporangiaceae bacterium]|nr:DHA2 family efflux MFS transporter permease subunit [Streptosporangiaceae bacterium]
MAAADTDSSAAAGSRAEQAVPTRHWITLAVLCLGTFAVLLDSTIVNVALPSMITALHASLDQALWVVNGYLLVFATLLILASRLGDLFGPRRLFTIGLAIFAISSALCGAAQQPGELIGARVLQGVGAAAMTPQAMVVIQAVFPRRRMGQAFGVFSSMVGLAAVSGPVLGGVITTDIGWRWIFYVNLPIAAAGIAGSYAFVPDVRTGRRHLLDVPGVLLGSAGLAVLLYGVIEGQRYSWGTVAHGITIPEIITAGALLLTAFCLWERRHAQPLLPGALLRNRTFTIMVVLNLATQFALQSMLLVNAINLQSVLGFTAVHAGLTGLPLTLALTAVAPFAGRLTDRVGGKYVLMAGLATYAAGIVGVTLLASAHATSLTFAPALLVAGLGMGAIFAPVATTAMRAAPRELAGAASGALNTGRQLGGTLGGAITGAVLATQLSSALRTRAAVAAAALPAPVRGPFVAGFAQAASAGLQVGRGQSAAVLPRTVPAPLMPRLEQLMHAVFVQSYLHAMRPTLAISVVLLVAGAAACLLLRRHPVAPPGTAAAVVPRAAELADRQ